MVKKDDVPKNVDPNDIYVQKPNLVKKGVSKWKEQFSAGRMYFLVLATCILFYYALQNLPNIMRLIENLIRPLKPIIYGLVIAYLLNPVVKRIENMLVKLQVNKLKFPESRAQTIGRSLGIVGALLLLFLFLALLSNMLIPELYKTIQDLVETIPPKISEWIQKLRDLQVSDSTIGRIFQSVITEGAKSVQGWMETDMLGKVNSVMGSLTASLIGMISNMFDIFVGLVISIYLLFGRVRFLTQMKKTLYALLSPTKANLVLHLSRKGNEIFGGFILGNVIDSAIIGVICFVLMKILKLDYALLISVVVAVTNIIPFFGPFIGGIPSALLLLMVDPIQCLKFIILIFILQQIEGNLIKPRVLGNAVGISSFWIIFAILFFGGIWGFVGMIIGVPIVALLYYIAQLFINQKLEKKNLPTHSSYYNDDSYVSEEGKFIHVEEDSFLKSEFKPEPSKEKEDK